MKLTRHYANGKSVTGGYGLRILSLFSDLFTGVTERREVDYFSQHLIEEMVKLKKFPMDIVFPQIWTDQKTQSLNTTKTKMEIPDTVLKEFDIGDVGDYLRARIGTGIYGAPAFDVRFLAYKSGKSKMIITRKEHSYPLELRNV